MKTWNTTLQRAMDTLEETQRDHTFFVHLVILRHSQMEPVEMDCDKMADKCFKIGCPAEPNHSVCVETLEIGKCPRGFGPKMKDMGKFCPIMSAVHVNRTTACMADDCALGRFYKNGDNEKIYYCGLNK